MSGGIVHERDSYIMSSSPSKRFLLLNGAGAGRGETNLIALSEGEEIIASHILAGRGASERFAPFVADLLQQSGWETPPDAVSAIIGPGSFTGLRASLSLAQGLATGWGVPSIGLRLGDVLREEETLLEYQNTLHILCLARRGRIFVDPPQGQEIYALQIEDIHPSQWSHIAGDAVFGSDKLAELVGENGCLTGEAAPILHPFAAPTAEAMRRATLRVFLGEEAAHPLMPLYIDPPEAKLPAAGLRPAPKEMTDL